MKVNKTIIYIECGYEPFVYELEDVVHLPKTTERIFINNKLYYVNDIRHEFENGIHEIFIYVDEIE